MTPINLGALRISEECGDLYGVVKHSTGFITGTHDVDIPSLPISAEARFRLAQWSLVMNAAVVEHEQQRLRPVAPAPRVAESAAPVVVQPAPVQREEPEAIKDAMDVSKNEERRRIERQAADENAFIARLQEYERVGLEPTPKNADKIVAFIKNHPQLKGHLSAAAADVAIAWLGSKGLTWKPKEAPAPPPPEPAEVLGTLPNGEPRLPIDVDNATLRRASKEQAKDYLARVNAGRLIRPSGSFRSSF
jgi:hypothetical protein